MYLSRIVGGVILWLALVVAAGLFLARNDAAPRHSPVPALRFGGADLVYVLRRVAAEANLVLALDEVRPLERGEDLALKFVHADLPGGTVDQVLSRLRRDFGGFDYRFYDRVLYVRSQLDLEADTGIDRKEIPGGTFEGDLRGLGDWIQQIRPATFLTVHLERGHPVGPIVHLRVPPESSVLDVLLLYTRETGVGWRMRRAGQQIEPAPGRVAWIATDVQPWKSLPKPENTAPLRQEGSFLQTLGRVVRRSDLPLCVLDATPLFMPRGTLDLGLAADPGLPVEESLDILAASHPESEPPPFGWEIRDGVAVLRVEGLDRIPTLGRLFERGVEGATFEGTLPELARWLDRQAAGEWRALGGEVDRSARTARMVIQPGTRLEDVLVEFARASGDSVYAVVYDRQRPGAEIPEPWRGVFLSRLLDWGEPATPY